MFQEYLMLRPKQLEQAIQEYPLALVPFGAMEWHSLHLPLGFDGIKVEQLLRKVGRRINHGILFPTVFWGAYETMKFPFTFHFPVRDLRNQVVNFAQDLYSMSFRIIIFLSGHYPALQTSHMRWVAEHMMKKHPDLAMLAIPEHSLCNDLEYYGDHAAKGETSLGLAMIPQMVDLIQLPNEKNYDDRINELGIMGDDPKIHASVEYGQQLQDSIVNQLCQRIEQVRKDKSPRAFYELYHISDQKADEFNQDWESIKKRKNNDLDQLNDDEKYQKWRAGHWKNSRSSR